MLKAIALTILVSFSILACEDASDLKYSQIDRKKSDYDKVINPSSNSNNPDLQRDIFLANYSYPIEVALYADGKMYYNLDNLGEGIGTWNFKGKNIIIETHGKRTLFDFKVKIFTVDNSAENFKIRFVDRFGTQELPLKILKK
jgi:hypothetical protein